MSMFSDSAVRGLVKTGCAAGLYWTGLGKTYGIHCGLAREPLVIGYHRIVEDFREAACRSIAPMLTSTSAFRQQLDWIGKHYDFVSLDDVARILEEDTPRKRPVAAVTFDDGYQDVHRNAFPVLKSKGIPFAVFVVTDLIGTNRLLPHDELYLLLSAAVSEARVPASEFWQKTVGRLGLGDDEAQLLYERIGRTIDPFKATRTILETFSQSGIRSVIDGFGAFRRTARSDLADFLALDWDMLREMSRSGGTIGSHTRTHALLANQPAGVIRNEVEGSKRILERELGISIEHFSYPDGSFSASSIAAVARAGYRTAHTICTHRDSSHPLLTIPRRMFWQSTGMNGFGRFSPAVLNCQVNGVFDPARKCRREHWRDQCAAAD